ncbi:CinA family protein [Nitrococcus mobilis]|uniref:Competence/damage-inducible protein CinA domain protein n=1 Tax=Nitrococcus mobilis Nb-231 TaxID=314278 RepID=A4BU35_9GAMM|nr:nicotinamide-nucleotide amidohydrolase family protein [Nitrococcus mobilis]EAR20709.1 competence/damage-inducible protein CinA domain protein [Nitrococcus mobilis Nb-231]
MITGERDLSELAQRVGRLLEARRLRLTTAESCTGGWIAKVLTDVPGCSRWFDRGLVTYSNAAKVELLDVPSRTLTAYGAVSQEVAVAMARGALTRGAAEVSVAVTGIAGPEGGTPAKPVGLVWLAWYRAGTVPVTEGTHFQGEREGIRRQAVAAALQGLIELLR